MSNDKKDKKNKESPESWWGLGILIIALILSVSAWLLWPESKPPASTGTSIVALPADYPLCAEQKIYDLRGKTTQITVQLHQNCWSGWIMLPETNYSAVVDTLSPGDLEYKFWNGERILIPDKSVAADISQGRNYGSAYRLRGYGEAIITKKEVI